MPSVTDFTTWAGLAALGVTQLGVFARVSNSVAVNARRLDEMERWQREKSIDRKELESVKEGSLNASAELHLRIAAVEREGKESAKILSDLRIDVARIPEQLRRQDDVRELHHKAVEHAIAGLKQMIYGVANKVGVITSPDL